LHWLEALPQALTRSHAHLNLVHAWALVHCAQPGAAEARARQAQALLEGDQGQLSGQVQAVRTLISNSRGDHARTIALARRALERLPQDDHTRRGIVALELGLAHAALNDFPAACAAFDQSIATGLAAGNAAIAVLALSGRAELQALQGELAQAQRSCQQALGQAAAWTQRQGRPLSFAGDAHVCLGQLLYERDELDAAERHASRGVTLSRQRASLTLLVRGYAILSLARQARGDPAGASQALDEAEQALASASAAARQIQSAEPGLWLTLVDEALARHKANLWLLQGNVQGAARWARARGLRADDKPHDFLAYLTLACLLLAQQKPAAPLLKRLLQIAEAQGWTGRVIKTLVLQACALQAQDNPQQAQVVLSRALLLAEPKGYVRPFLDAGAGIQALLRQAAGRDSASYAAQLLANPGASSFVLCPLSLTQRELQVLQLIAQNLPNQEIADKLFISINTVKTHVKRIYAKLDAHDRFQALQRAAELDLFPPTPRD
jgi:LuxR family maltose regulon positive regulatory protein